MHSLPSKLYRMHFSSCAALLDCMSMSEKRSHSATATNNAIASRVVVALHTLRCGFCDRAGSLLITAVEAALRIPQQLPTSKPLRARFISFLHRMVKTEQLAMCWVIIADLLGFVPRVISLAPIGRKVMIVLASVTCILHACGTWY